MMQSIFSKYEGEVVKFNGEMRKTNSKDQFAVSGSCRALLQCKLQQTYNNNSRRTPVDSSPYRSGG